MPAMVDSGATECYIHKSLVDQFDIPVTQLNQPIPIEVADGRPIRSGAITHHTFPVSMSVQKHRERVTFFVTNIGQHSIILSGSWLKKHNPHINWSKRNIDFNSDFCLSSCMMEPNTPSRIKKSHQSDTSIPYDQQSVPPLEKSYN
jgi:hypothetical protein